ncbi:M20/M25/M40 family metallo-hydrolase [Streptomyces sp. NBC_01207]|uniref:M20/M25/M40 family metallo-hydrolase n=1 Tax=Streptomyces sp. NBC_01207 TaxID=2903772 RepID=UPI002E15E06A|nr:M20/M25/M40 family metallo-hydrolase [Streptomyces sp. NBC_01207]
MSTTTTTTTTTALDGVAISEERFLDDLVHFASIGGRPDGGVDRVAGSAADVAGRAWFAQRIVDAGLVQHVDAIGNVFGTAPGSEGPYLLIGSHTDTVPAGGRLDGAYGTIAGLEILRALHEAGHPAARSLQIVGFFDEEGARPDSTGGLTGSTAFCSGEGIRDISAFVELHIEQGPRMEAAGTDLAVVEGIVGVQRFAVTFFGETNHAGTTPMTGRADAGRAAMKLASRVQPMVLGIDRSMVMNIGFIEFLPGAPNVVPGEARLVVEWRSGSPYALTEATRELEALARWTAADENCTVSVERISDKRITEFDPALCDTVERACRTTGGRMERLLSYAGHDASVLAQHVPTAMLFVPSRGGVSHSPKEDTSDAQLVRGCRALLQSVIEYGARDADGS